MGNRHAIGIGSNGSYRVDDKGIVSLRADLNWLNRGLKIRTTDVPSPFGGTTEAEVTTSHDIVFLQAGPELSATILRLRPYIGARAGIAYYVTTTSVHRDGLDENIDASRDDHVTIFSYGAHGGVRVPVTSRASLDLGAEYQWRSEGFGFHIGASIPITPTQKK